MFSENGIYLLPIIILFIIRGLIWNRLESKYGNSDLSRRPSVRLNLLINIFELLLRGLMLFQITEDVLTIDVTNLNHIFIYVGYLIIISSSIISYLGFVSLGKNWRPMTFYPPANRHKLITSGVYKYIRHPIYLSIILDFISYELVARSWLVVFVPTILFVFINYRIKIEDKELEKRFKNKFRKYKSKTSALVPFIF